MIDYSSTEQERQTRIKRREMNDTVSDVCRTEQSRLQSQSSFVSAASRVRFVHGSSTLYRLATAVTPTEPKLWAFHVSRVSENLFTPGSHCNNRIQWT